jgi:hypothetical protein
MRRSGVGDLSGEAEEVESNLSSADGFVPGSERDSLCGEETFSLVASVVDMVDATRRNGQRLGNEDGTEEVEHMHHDGLLVFLRQDRHCCLRGYKI